MKKYITGFIIGVILSAAIAFNIPQSSRITQKEINNETLNAVLWMQTSAEYRALCYQAYNSALEHVRNAAESFRSGDKPIAIVLDCDETVIDNIAPDAAIIDSEKTLSELFSAWFTEGRPEALPGAADFLNAVDELGANIFYVTNRQEQFKTETTNIMKALNFPQVNDAHVILRDDESSKDSRFRKIENDYNVILYLGDSAHDFPMGIYGKNLEERNAIADANKSLFGKKYIVLPNPVYGSWLNLFNGKTPEETHKAKTNALKIWTPKTVK